MRDAHPAHTTASDARQAAHQIAQLRVRVEEQIFTLLRRLDATMNRAQHGEKCLVVVDGRRYY